MPKPTQGHIILPNGLIPEPHELATAAIFTKQGYEVRFIPLPAQKANDLQTSSSTISSGRLSPPPANQNEPSRSSSVAPTSNPQPLIIEGHRTKLDDQSIVKALHKQDQVTDIYP